MKPIVLSIVVFFGFALSADAKLYKWVDENGVPHYSNTAPPEAGQVETRVESEGSSSPGSHDLGDVIESYRRDGVEPKKEFPRISKPSGKSESRADDLAARIRKQEVRISDIEADLTNAKRETYTDYNYHKKKVRRYESRLEKAEIELERLKTEYKRARYGE
jgi:predicted RNase H-like nuclease (RuvC/YqgF family)